jgi:hypothetical protein
VPEFPQRRHLSYQQPSQIRIHPTVCYLKHLLWLTARDELIAKSSESQFLDTSILWIQNRIGILLTATSIPDAESYTCQIWGLFSWSIYLWEGWYWNIIKLEYKCLFITAQFEILQFYSLPSRL